MAENRRLQEKRNTHPWLGGVMAALPIMLGYLPVGFAYGVLAHKAGLSTFNTLMMSMIVYAGSAQLIAVGLVANGITSLTIILTTFIVNLRHLLMSAAIFPHIARWQKRELAGFAYELTDETFALHSTRFYLGQVEKSEAFIINIVSHITWVLGGWMGVVVGQLLVDVEPLALDYVLPAMFIGLLVMQIKNRTQVWVALLAGTASVAFLVLGFSQLHVIIATIIGATFGAWMEGWTRI
jgi:4-azaleucine resistance transporter AzlC